MKDEKRKPGRPVVQPLSASLCIRLPLKDIKGINSLAEALGVPKTEIYRRAVTEYIKEHAAGGQVAS